jgi:1-deoxy-D-xylulose-5-phosphate reductoisomerase
MRRISVFGATGSIGQNTLDLIARAPGAYDVVALTGGGNIAQLAEDAKRLARMWPSPPTRTGWTTCAPRWPDRGSRPRRGRRALIEAADRPADWIMSAIVGAAGLAPGFRALRHGTTLALANKESLVTAGPLLLAEARGP